MFVKRIAASGIAALFISACGGGMEAQPPRETGQAEQAIIWQCTAGSQWTRYWYTNYTHTTLQGEEDCYCDGTLVQYGTVGGSYSQVAGPACY